MKRSYAFIGCGGVGGYYGACLQKAGFDVHFLVRSDYRFIKDNGLRVDSVRGGFTLRSVQVYATPENMPACDVTIVAVKATSNHLLPAILTHTVKKNGTVILLQNGMGQEELLARTVPAECILGGQAFLCSRKLGPGHIEHQDYGALTFAQFTPDGSPGGGTERMRDAADDFRSAGLEVNLKDDLQAARWRKLVWNVPFNGLTVILNSDTRQIMRFPQTRRLVEQLMVEIASASAAWNKPIERAFVDLMMDDTDRMIPYSPSMKLDFDNQREMEIEAIYGVPMRRAEQKNVAVPLIKMMHAQLSFLDSRHSSTASGKA
jgi:2-dehydropantoate 2-reductase